MFYDKTRVDQHVAEVTLTYTENQINLSSYYIARNYYDVGDYETAEKYVLRYLKVQEASADAHKLLGQIFDARDQKEAALAKAKFSQTDDKAVNFEYKCESMSGTLGAMFHVKLLDHYMKKKKLELGYKHVLDVEENHDFKDNIAWTQKVCQFLEMCKIMHSFDFKFWRVYSSCLERLTKFFIKKGVGKPPPQFRPFIDKDDMIENGVSKRISFRYQCITCTKEYEGKSMEEVRLGYYVAARKEQPRGLESPMSSIRATDQSTVPTFHCLIKPSTGLRATDTKRRGFTRPMFRPLYKQTTHPILFGGAAQTSGFGSANTIQTPFKGFYGNSTAGPNFFGGVQSNKSTGALNKNNESVESAKDVGFSFGSPKSIQFGVSTGPEFVNESLLSDQANTSKLFGSTKTTFDSTVGAFGWGNNTGANESGKTTAVETLGERKGVNPAERNSGANRVDQLVLDQIKKLTESKETMLKNVRTWQEQVAGLKETLKYSKCDLHTVVEAELLDGSALYNVLTRQEKIMLDDPASTEETKTVATNAISVEAHQKDDSLKPKAGDIFGMAGKFKTQDDANFQVGFGQAKAGFSTTVETVSKTEGQANNIAKASKAKTSLPSFSFGTPATAPKALASNFNFKISKSDAKVAGDSAKAPIGFTFGSSKLNSSTTFSFGTPQNLGLSQNPDKPYTGLLFGSPEKSFNYQFRANSTSKTPGDGKTSKQEVVQSVDVYFAPVVPLPDKVDTETGEENEEILYSHRAKLFRYVSKEKEWKERGLGEIKLLKHRETDKLRLLMRRDSVLKLCLNHIITADFNFTPKDHKTWLWYAADYSQGDISHETFACRFRTAEVAQEFKTAIDNARGSTEAPADEAAGSLSSDIEIVYAAMVTSEEKSAALKLNLPENFYAYKRMPDCPGCRGCEANQETSLSNNNFEVPKLKFPPSSVLQ